MAITIVGLGPGDGRMLTREAWEVLVSAETLYLRTQDHPAVADLPSTLTWHSFDAVYAAQSDFEAVYAHIVGEILRLGQLGPVCYGVPGHPFIGEATVQGIVAGAREQGLSVRIVAGLSFVEPALTAVGVDGLDGLQILDAIDVARREYPVLLPDMPLLLGQVYSRWLASDLKLTLMRAYPDEHRVYLIHAAGSAGQLVETLPLYAIDRSPHIRNLTALYVPPLPLVSSLPGFAETVAILRSPHGCPWDREQTSQSLREGFLEEAAEVLDALDKGDMEALREELGDVVLHVVMQAQIATEMDEFTLTEVLAGIDAKIKRRHPHVWGEAVVHNIEQLLDNWEAIKAQEKPAQATSLLHNVPLALPALARAQKIQQRVARIGFDWPDIGGVWAKLQEEIGELQAAETTGERSAELGDVLFVLANLARWLKLDAESALREANLRFTRRFQQMERLANERGQAIVQLPQDALESLWQEVKRHDDEHPAI